MRKITAVQVTYEALGRESKCFTEKLDFDYITDTISLIAPTARVTNVCTTIIEPSILKDQNLDDIRSWYQSISETFSHVDKEAIQ